MERVLRQLTAEHGPGVATADGSLMALVDKLEAVQAGKREPVLASGINALDYATGGLPPTLNIWGSLPGVGKSALIATSVKNIAGRGVRVGVLSLEDEREWLTERLVAEAAAVPLFLLGNRPLGRNQLDRIYTAAKQVHAVLSNVLIEDAQAMKSSEVVAAARAMVARGCKAVFIDHLGEIRFDRGRSQRADLDVREVLQDLRGIAKIYRVPVVVACHLGRVSNRGGEERKAVPQLTDFADSAAIERMARVALGLFSPTKDELGVAVLKQTRGPSGFDFRLNRATLYGTIAQTEPSPQMLEALGSWRDL